MHKHIAYTRCITECTRNGRKALKCGRNERKMWKEMCFAICRAIEKTRNERLLHVQPTNRILLRLVVTCTLDGILHETHVRVAAMTVVLVFVHTHAHRLCSTHSCFDICVAASIAIGECIHLVTNFTVSCVVRFSIWYCFVAAAGATAAQLPHERRLGLTI